jgi:hypothetical protein
VDSGGAAPEGYEAGPSAAALIEGLRDFGYTLETALADVVDNSITADAQTIRIFADFNAGDPRIAIVDDGSGMSEAELRIAMRPGGRSPSDGRKASDLGRFGLGMKTASFSQGRRLTVVTSKAGQRSVARWDLDFVAKADRWLVLVPDPSESIPWSDELGDRGTLVVWEQLDRLVEKSAGANASKEFNRRLTSARSHLELVFHRFLQGEPGHKAIRILLNNAELTPFDPFHTKNAATTQGPPEVIGLSGDKIVVRGYTLPHHSKVSADEWERYAGTAGYVRSQGFYLYRARRLIVHGTWFGLVRQTSLTRLARVRIDMPNTMDALWKVNVLKASAHPPHQIREKLGNIIENFVSTSRRVYTHRGPKLTQDNKYPVWERRASHGTVTYLVNGDHPVFRALRARMEPDLRSELDKVLEMVGASLPVDALFVDLGDDPENIKGAPASDATLQSLVEITFRGLLDQGFASKDITQTMKLSEPYRSNWDRVGSMIEILLTANAEEWGGKNA